MPAIGAMAKFENMSFVASVVASKLKKYIYFDGTLYPMYHFIEINVHIYFELAQLLLFIYLFLNLEANILTTKGIASNLRQWSILRCFSLLSV